MEKCSNVVCKRRQKNNSDAKRDGRVVTDVSFKHACSAALWAMGMKFWGW